MKKRFRWITVLFLPTFFMMILSSCSIKKDKEITVWSSLTDKEVLELRKLGEQWGKENGYKVKVHSDKGDTKAYMGAVKAGIGPDIEFGVSHIKLEKLYSEKLLGEVPQGSIDSSKYLEQGLRTVVFDNKTYGIPLTMYTYGLYYNSKIVSTLPKTFEEFVEMAKKAGFQYDINNFYLSYSFLAAQGGYIFKNYGGKYDIQDIGLGNEGAVKGYGILQDFVQKYKFMPSTIESRPARENFIAGNVGFYLSGPWDMEEFHKANMEFGVMPLPTFNNKPMSSLVNVQVAYVNAQTKHPKEAVELMKYLAERSPLMIYKLTGKIPVLKSALEDPVIKNDARVSAFVQQAKNGEAIPNISEIQALQSVNESMKLLTSGKMSSKEFGDKIVKDIQDFIQKQKK